MYLVLHSSYTHVEVALYQKGVFVDTIRIDKYQASSQLLVAIAALCAQHGLPSAQLEFIVVHAGPGPFTTLRTVLATANGLAFAQGIKLVGIDGLKALLTEYHDAAYPVTIALLNAYSNDLYYAYDNRGQVTTGILYGIDSLKQMLQQVDRSVTLVRLIGNGVLLHEPLIRQVCGAQAYIPVPIPETCSLQAVAHQGYQQWLAHEDVSDQVVPLYLKNISF